MPLPLPQTLTFAQRFREKLDPVLRGEFDQLAASLQKQIPGIGVSRQLEISDMEILPSLGSTGTVSLPAGRTNSFVSYSLLLHELMLVNFFFNAITITGTTAAVCIRIPGGYRIKYGEYIEAVHSMTDSGTRVVGRTIVNNKYFPNFSRDDTICLYRFDYANLTAGTFTAFGQILFPVEVTPVVT